MSATFKIGSADTAGDNASLLIEISQHGVAYVVINDNKECIALQSQYFSADYNFDKTANALKHLASQENILHQPFKSTVIVYAYPEALLAPADFLPEQHKKDMLELVHGDITDAFTRTDFLYRHHIHNVYTVPRQIDAVVSYLFNSPVSTHLYSLLPDMFRKQGNYLYCIFNTSGFTAMLLKEGKLQAVQTYKFKTPEDVAYYLLQLCEAFEVDVNSVIVYLNGMIESSSNLYAGLYKYFLNLEFAALPAGFSYPEEISNYPPHYFSYLFAVASCVL